MILVKDENHVCPISPDCGKEVIAIHTGRGHGPLGYGMGYLVGTLDFLPNDGDSQPQCSSTDYVCDHMMALHYFRLSIKSPYCYTSVLCPGFWNYVNRNCRGFQTQMGFHTDNLVSGGYYTKMFTYPRRPYPYCDQDYYKYRIICTGAFPLNEPTNRAYQCIPMFYETGASAISSWPQIGTYPCMSYDSAAIRTRLVYYSKELKDSIVINGNLYKEEDELSSYFPANVQVNSLAVLVHGYGKFDRQNQENVISLIKNSLLSYYNVVAIYEWWKFTDWHLSNHSFVAAKTPGAAFVLADFIHKWRDRGLDPSKIHFVCQGLGVQVCSYAAKRLKQGYKEEYRYPIGKITGKRVIFIDLNIHSLIF